MASKTSILLGMCQIDKGNLHEQRSMECVDLGKAISNVTLELKPGDWVAEWSLWRVRVWIELRDSPTEQRLQTWRAME